LMTDPCFYLPYEIFTNILSYLEPVHLSKTSLVSQQWNEGSNSNYVWDTLCRLLWQDKVYVPDEITQIKNDGDPKLAYENSIKDMERQYLTQEELCKFTWSFRFKEAAGEHWVENDPWWHGQPPQRSMFLPGGKTKYVDDNNQTKARAPRMERRWKFISHAAGRDGPEGAFIQVNNYPPYIVSRYRNGGFIMQSCWVVYTSFPLPPLGACPDLEDAALDVTTDTMSTEAMRYNIGVEFNLQDQGHIVNLLQLLAQIQHHNGVNFVNVNDLGTGEDDDEDEDEHEGDEDDEDDDNEDDDENMEDNYNENDDDDDDDGVMDEVDE